MNRRPALVLLVAFALAAVLAPPVPLAVAEEKPAYLDKAKPVEARVEDLLKRLTLDEKLAARPRRLEVHDRRHPAPRDPAALALRRARTACARTSAPTTGTPPAAPTTSRRGCRWAWPWPPPGTPTSRKAYGETIGAGSPRPRQAHHAGPGREHPPHAAQRPELRVLRRGPLPRRPHGRALDPRGAVAGRRRLREALRAQQPGVAAGHDRRRGRRADAARDLPARLRGGGEGRWSPRPSWAPTTSSAGSTPATTTTC